MVSDVLDVEGDDLQAHLLQVLLRILLDALGECGAVGDDVCQLHLADDRAQVPLEGIAHLLGDFGRRLVEEVAGRGAKQGRVVGCDTYLHGCVHAHVDVVVCGNKVGGLGVDGDHRSRHGIHALQERDLPTGLAVQDPLSAGPRDDLDLARRSRHEARPQEENNEDERGKDARDDGDKRHDSCFRSTMRRTR